METKRAYRLIEHKDAQKFLRKQNKDFREKIYKAYNEIITNPFNNVDSKKMKGYENRYRKRVGDFRIIYEIRNMELLIIVITIDSRGQVYKNL